MADFVQGIRYTRELDPAGRPVDEGVDSYIIVFECGKVTTQVCRREN